MLRGVLTEALERNSSPGVVTGDLLEKNKIKLTRLLPTRRRLQVFELIQVLVLVRETLLHTIVKRTACGFREFGYSKYSIAGHSRSVGKTG